MIRSRLSESDLLGMVEETREELLEQLAPRTQAGAELIVKRAKRNLALKRGTAATASEPGSPPQYVSGELHDSVKVFRTRKTKYSVRTEYGSDHPAAGVHEWGGTVGGIRSTGRNRERDEAMEQGAALVGHSVFGAKRTYPPRPYLRPAEDSAEGEVRKILDGES